MAEHAEPKPPPRPRVDGPLDSVNDGFHDGYDGARERAQRGVPVLVVLGDSLILVRGEERHERAFTPRLFHVIKSVAHAPVGLYNLVADALVPSGEEPRPFDDALRARLTSFDAALSRSLGSLDELEDADAELLTTMRELLRASSNAMAELSTPRADASTLEEFARSAGPDLLRLTGHATRVQLDALDESVSELLAPLAAEERRHLRVVVTGDHQARARSLGMQYFQKRMPAGEGGEERVTYAEEVSDVHSALALIGRQRFDLRVAQAFFDDPTRLQRDVLGDAVRDQLASRTLTPIA